jgi:hypothetical protein
VTLRRRVWLLLPVATFLVIDVALTLCGQSHEYWAGDHETALEGNPLALHFLRLGPGSFVLAAAAWTTVLAILILGWRHWISTGIAMLEAIGHAVGGSTWIARSGGLNWLLAICFLLIAAEFASRCWRRGADFPTAGTTR